MLYKFVFFILFSVFVIVNIQCGGKTATASTVANGDKLLASAYSENLYYSEIQPLIQENMTPEDSLKIVNGTIQKWIRDRVMLHVVADRVKSTPEIDALVENYRNSLLLQQYRREKQAERPDTVITEAQFKAAYDTLGSTLANENTVVNADFVAIPAVWKDMAAFTKIWSNADDTKSLSDFCQKNAEGFFVNTWLSFDELAAKMPKGALQESSLAANKTFTIKKPDTHYYIRIRDLQKKGEVASLEASKKRLRAIILQERQTQGYTRLVEEAYQAELKAGRIELK